MTQESQVTWQCIRPTVVNSPVPPLDLLQGTPGAADALASFVQSANRQNESILLIVNDPDRSTLTRPVLTWLAQCARPMARQPRFRALIATGTHRFSADTKRSFQQSTFSDCGLPIEEIAWHDAVDAQCLVDVAGVRMHHWIDEHRFLLPIGSVEPHYHAGVTGPHKTVTIGCLSREDIERNHAHTLSPASDMLHLHGNPIFDGAAEILGRLQVAGKTIFAFGQIVQGQELVEAAVGDPLEVVDSLLPRVKEIYVHETPQPVDLLHLEVPEPLGHTLYQADKALKNNHQALRDGGGIILEARCDGGVGPDAFLDLLRRTSGYEDACDRVRRDGYRLGDHKAVKLHHLTDPACRNVRVAVVASGLAPEDLTGTPLELFADIESALEWLIGKATGRARRGLVIEDAGMMCAKAAPQSA